MHERKKAHYFLKTIFFSIEFRGGNSSAQPLTAQVQRTLAVALPTN